MEKDIKEEPDFSSLNKYFKEDIKKTKPVKIKTIIEDISISELQVSYFGGEAEIETRGDNQEIEKESIEGSKKVVDAKKEFLKFIEEDDSLKLDICASVNRDWGRK